MHKYTVHMDMQYSMIHKHAVHMAVQPTHTHFPEAGIRSSVTITCSLVEVVKRLLQVPLHTMHTSHVELREEELGGEAYGAQHR